MRRWLPDAPVRAVVQIVHGMAEHVGRYGRFAERLTASGYAVYANDHRGHGDSAQFGVLGHLGDNGGWDRVVADLFEIADLIGERHPGLPILLFGHSMGALLSREIIARGAEPYAGVVLSGSAGRPPPAITDLLALARTERERCGQRGISDALTQASFGRFNSMIDNPRTDADWLTTDEAEVDAAIADPFWGFPMTTQAWVDLLEWQIQHWQRDFWPAGGRRLPLHILAGAGDPVGRFGDGVRELADTYRAAGLEDLSLKIYPDGRHEMLNERNREEVMTDVISWFDGVLKRVL